MMRAKTVRVTEPVDETPDQTWTKTEITDYFDFHEIEYTTSMTKAELLDQIR